MNVQFPGLGIDFVIRNWAFEVFGLRIYWYGILIAAAFLVAVLLALKSCKKYDLVPDHILDLVLFAAPSAVIFARLYYVVFQWDMFKDDLAGIFNTRNGGLAIYGGVIGAFLAAFLYTRYRKIPFLHMLDFGVPYLALGQAIGRWGNFVNQEAYGAATTLPWRMNGDEANAYLQSLEVPLDPAKWGVHPTFLYESLLCIALFFFLAWYRDKKKVRGEVLFLYLIIYGTGRALIEGLRTDSLWLGAFRVSQLLSVLLVLFGITMFILRRMKLNKKVEEEPAAIGQSEYGALLAKLRDEEQAEKEQAKAEKAQAHNGKEIAGAEEQAAGQNAEAPEDTN